MVYIIEKTEKQLLISDTDTGKEIMEQIKILKLFCPLGLIKLALRVFSLTYPRKVVYNTITML